MNSDQAPRPHTERAGLRATTGRADVVVSPADLQVAGVDASSAISRQWAVVPLFQDEDARRDQLEPLAHLTARIEKTVRLNPRSEDVNVLLPALAEQVVSVEQERDASVLALSTLHFHTDRTDPKPILAKSWKPAEGKARCQHARPGVIVLGDGQGTRG